MWSFGWIIVKFVKNAASHFRDIHTISKIIAQPLFSIMIQNMSFINIS